MKKKWHGEDVVGKKCYQAYQNQEEPCPNCPTLRCLESGKVEKEEALVHTAQGEKWHEIFSYPLADPQTKEISGVVEFVRDITEQKEKEKQLKDSEERLNTLIFQTPAVIFSYKIVDAVPQITYVNENVRNVLGFEPEDFIKTKHFSKSAFTLMIPRRSLIPYQS